MNSVFLKSAGETLGSGTCRPFRGTANDGFQYAIKTQKAGESSRLLINDFFGTLLAKELGLPVPDPSIVTITRALATQHNIALPKDGDVIAFGSRFWENSEAHTPDPNNAKYFDESVKSLVAGSIVFDTWVWNEDARQFLGLQVDSRMSLKLFDNDGAFNRNDWLIEKPTSKVSFQKRELIEWSETQLYNKNETLFNDWLVRLENINKAQLENLGGHLPPQWLNSINGNFKNGKFAELISALDRRRFRVRGLLFG